MEQPQFRFKKEKQGHSQKVESPCMPILLLNRTFFDRKIVND